MSRANPKRRPSSAPRASATPFFHITAPFSDPSDDSKARWPRVGRAFVNDATDEHPLSLTLKLHAAPREARLTLFPPEDQAPIELDDGQRLDVVVQTESANGNGERYSHRVGAAFYNGGSRERGESINVLLDCIPFSSVVYLRIADDAQHDGDE